jgi:RNA polymerase sigma-70 factor (ECF subfamily)
MLMRDLCNQLARNVENAFPEFVREMGDDVYSGLRRMHPEDAADLTQETFIRAYRALTEYDAERIRGLQLRGWIWTIALNLGRNHIRDRSRRPQPAMLHDIHGIGDPDPVDDALWHSRFARLTPHQRTSVVLRHVVGLSYPEIAQAVGRAEGTVKADVSRGLVKLRSIIEEEQ